MDRPTGGHVDIDLPDPAVVLLIGIAGCGKSTFAARHFDPTEVLSSDLCRELVSGDPSDQSATADAFDVLVFVLDKRLRRRRLTVVDATNLRRAERARYLRLAQAHGVPSAAIVLDVPFEVCRRRDAERTERTVGEQVLRRQQRELRQGMVELRDDPDALVAVLSSPEQVEAARVRRWRGDPQR